MSHRTCSRVVAFAAAIACISTLSGCVRVGRRESRHERHEERREEREERHEERHDRR